MAEETYRVFARRFRPLTFEEVSGQEHITKTLRAAVETGRLAQAYLFSGPRGVGKTSVARILAKSLNCEKGPTTKPCGECVSCVAVARGDDTDVLEIDGASNRGIDEIRELREKARYAPIHGRYKIYIIDEVHMLTDQAFNALLKTLEEPPAKVIFIFATTRVEKVPTTILSRCQRFTFRRIPAELIFNKLKAIASTDGIEADDEALMLIARRAGGSFRDAESLFEQVIAYSGGRITARDVEATLGLVTSESAEELVLSVLEADPARALSAIDRLAVEGADLVQATHQAVEYLRNLMVLVTAPHADELIDLSHEEIEKLKSVAETVRPSRVLAVLNCFVETASRPSKNLPPRLSLEVTAVRAAKAMNVIPIEELLEALNDPGKLEELASSGTTSPNKTGKIPAAPPRETENLIARADEEEAPVPISSPASRKAAAPAATPRLSGSSAVELWDGLLDELDKTNKPLFTVLSNGRLKSYRDDVLTVAFPETHKVMAEMVNDPARRNDLQKLLKDLTGRDVAVKAVTEEGQEKPETTPRGLFADPVLNLVREKLGAEVEEEIEKSRPEEEEA